MNTCRMAQSLLFEKADGRLAAKARAEVDAHLAFCPHCQQIFAEWTSALPRLRNLPEDEISAVSLRRMESEILRDLPGAARPRSRRTLVWALAVGLVLAVGVGLLSLRSATSPPFARLQTLWGKVTLSGVAMSTGAVMAPGAETEQQFSERDDALHGDRRCSSILPGRAFCRAATVTDIMAQTAGMPIPPSWPTEAL